MAASGSIWSRNVVAGSITATSITADDLDVDGTTLTIDADNNFVGIGLSNPTQLFHVEGPMVQDWVSRIKNTHSTSGQSYGLQVIAGTSASDVSFAVKNQANSATYLEVQGDGKVGIGTNAPSTTLDVDGTITATGITAATAGCIFGTVEFNSTVADESVSGIVATFTAGETLVRGDAVYYKAGDSRMHRVNMTVDNTEAKPVVALAAADISSGVAGSFLLQGFIHDAGTFATFVAGDIIYAPEAEGGPTKTAPSTSGDTVQVIGWATTADSIYFNPSNDTLVVA